MKKKLKVIKNLDYFDIDPLRFRGRDFFLKVLKDKDEYLKRYSYLTSKNNFCCPLCQKKRIKLFLKISTRYQILECKFCGLKFPNVNFKKIKDYTNIIYKKYSNLLHRKNVLKTSDYRVKMIKEKYDFCITENFKNTKNIKVLDYGCGEGSFLEYLKIKKINHIGFEVDKVSIEKLKNKKISFCENLDVISSNSLDVCVMFDVIEHLTNPISTLNTIRKKLKKNGKIIIYTPNINSLAFELMGKNQNQVYPFQHIYFFDHKSFNFLCKKTRLKIKSLSTYGLDLMDYFFMKEYHDKTKYFDKLREFINKTQSIIDLSGYGNHFRLILQKKII